MRVVIDTNVIVSALLKPGSVPDRALAALWSRGATVLYDARITSEYQAVLARPKFASIDRERADALLAAIARRGTAVDPVEPWSGTMIDADDRIFVEVALSGRADAIVTGNGKHYPTDLSFEVLAPATLLERLSN